MTAAWRTGVLRGAGPPAGHGAVVVKFGGSLLTRPDWAREVFALLDSLSGPCLVVVGGGPLVDGLRTIDRAAPRPADVVHRLAIDCMGLTARLVAAGLGLPLVTDAHVSGPPMAVLDVPAWIDRDGRFTRLPVGWHVTSDSIAATVAAELGCGLLLLKSTPPVSDEIDQVAAAGWVDEWFPTAARALAGIAWATPA